MFDVMRTTLTIDDDILALAKGLAARDGKSIGDVISSLARQGIRHSRATAKTRNGVPLLPIRPDSLPVTPELVQSLRDELP